jgi:hypothetical protein
MHRSRVVPFKSPAGLFKGFGYTLFIPICPVVNLMNVTVLRTFAWITNVFSTKVTVAVLLIQAAEPRNICRKQPIRVNPCKFVDKKTPRFGH